jgi:hypothetical protein
MQKKVGALLLYFCLGMAGFVFATGCFIIYISGLVLDLVAFVKDQPAIFVIACPYLRGGYFLSAYS